MCTTGYAIGNSWRLRKGFVFPGMGSGKEMICTARVEGGEGK
jgi:hypothetical protein